MRLSNYSDQRMLGILRMVQGMGGSSLRTVTGGYCLEVSTLFPSSNDWTRMAVRTRGVGVRPEVKP